MAMTGQATATEAEVGKGIRGKLVEGLKSVVADGEELLKASASQTGERIAAARAEAEESLKAAKARLAEQESAVITKTKSVAKADDDSVRANPWKALGIVAAAGFVLGILAARLGQSVIEAGERMIIKGGRAIHVAEKEAQKLFKWYRRLGPKPIL
jgi:ElaB/YqjD/DUF883 family membrane-anchored ribosome-binding protein